jgi:hypothetical protein
VAIPTIYERCHQLSHWPKVYLFTRHTRCFIEEHTFQEAAQPHGVRRRRYIRAVILQAHSTRDIATRSIIRVNFNVMRSDFLVPAVADPTIVFEVAGIPLGDLVLEILPELICDLIQRRITLVVLGAILAVSCGRCAIGPVWRFILARSISATITWIGLATWLAVTVSTAIALRTHSGPLLAALRRFNRRRFPEAIQAWVARAVPHAV